MILRHGLVWMPGDVYPYILFYLDGTFPYGGRSVAFANRCSPELKFGFVLWERYRDTEFKVQGLYNVTDGNLIVSGVSSQIGQILIENALNVRKVNKYFTKNTPIYRLLGMSLRIV